MKETGSGPGIASHLRRERNRIRIPRNKGIGVLFLLVLVLSLGVFYTRALVPAQVYAAPANELNFQARLLNSSGSLVPDGNYSVQFRLYTASTDGTQEWTETQASVPVKNGYFSARLGSVNPFSGGIDWSEKKWLTLEVNGDGEMNPRIQLTAVPFAFRAGQADGLTSGTGVLAAGGILQLSPGALQGVNSAVSGLRFNQIGSGGLVQLQGDGTDAFTVSKLGAGYFRGSLNIDGGVLDIGSAVLKGGLVMHDGGGNTLTLQAGAQGGDLVFTFPNSYGNDGDCLRTTSSGQLSFGACGGAGNVFAQDGSSFGALAVLGTNDEQELALETNGVEQVRIDLDGNVGIGTNNPSEKLEVNGAIKLGSTANANAGTLRWTGIDFEGYNGTQWVSLTQGGGLSGGSSDGKVMQTFNTYSINQAANANTAQNFLMPTTATAYSIAVAGTNEIMMNSAGSIRACSIMNSAAVSGGSVSVQFMKNGTPLTSNLYCPLSTTVTRSNSQQITSGVETFEAGDTIGVRLVSTGLAPTTAEHWVSFVVEFGSSQASSDFSQGGNEFGATAVLGTTDAFGLNIMTNGSTALAIDISGNVSLTQGLQILSGGADITGNTIINGSLSGLTGLAMVSGDISLVSGAITGVGSDISGTGALVLSSGGSGDLTLSAASDKLILNASTWERIASGTTIIDLRDSGETGLLIRNSDGLAGANLEVEGSVLAAEFTGSGTGLTDLDASNIANGTLNDARLSGNIARLDTEETFLERVAFISGLTVGNTTNTTAGTLRWTGADFEGYNGSEWVSLTSGGGLGAGSGSSATLAKTKTANETINNSATLQDDDHLFFAVEANQSWTFRFVVQANSGITPDLQFAVSAPAGSTCQVGAISSDGSNSVSNLSCGITTGLLPGSGSDDIYEITGTVTAGATAGNVRLRWAQNTATASNTVVYSGSYMNATIVDGTLSTGGGESGLSFVQNGNDFGSTAILGTTDGFGLNIVTNGNAALTITSAGVATFVNDLLLNGGLTIGNESTDGLVINSSSVSLPNGLNFDSDTLVINSADDRVGIGTALPSNKLTINTANTVDNAAQAFIYTNGTTNKGLSIQRTSGQVANLFEAQNESGQALAFINNNGEMGLGQSGSSNGTIIFSNASNTNTLTLQTSVVTGLRSIALPDEDGILCVRNSDNCGFIRLSKGSAQVDSTANDSIFINKTNAAGNLLTLQRNGNGVFTIFNNGSMQVSADASAALQVRNAAGNVSYFTVNTSGNIVQVGSATTDATAMLFVLDSSTSSSDPTGVNGASYYNTASNSARCFENGYWSDCQTTRVQNDVTIDTAAASINLTLAGNETGLRCSLMLTGRSAAAGVQMRLNNVSAANSYNYNVLQNLTGANNNTTSNSSAGATQILLNGTATSTGSFSANVNITNFTTVFKNIDWTAGGTDGTSVPNNFKGSAVFRNSTDSINSIQFFPSTGNFNAGSRAWCEGR